MVQDVLWGSLHYVYEPVFTRCPTKELRESALNTVMQHIHYEDENTRYICIGPVNKVCMQNIFYAYHHLPIDLIHILPLELRN